MANGQTHVVGDERLKRLFEYTKFHIGLYTSVTTLLIGIARFDQQEFGSGFRVALLSMLGAGICGGIVGSNAYECETFEEFSSSRFFPFYGRVKKNRRWVPTGKMWAHLEHAFFWTAILSAALPLALCNTR